MISHAPERPSARDRAKRHCRTILRKPPFRFTARGICRFGAELAPMDRGGLHRTYAIISLRNDDNLCSLAWNMALQSVCPSTARRSSTLHPVSFRSVLKISVAGEWAGIILNPLYNSCDQPRDAPSLSPIHRFCRAGASGPYRA